MKVLALSAIIISLINPSSMDRVEGCPPAILPPDLVSLQNLPNTSFSIQFYAFLCGQRKFSIATLACLQVANEKYSRALEFDNCTDLNLAPNNFCLLRIAYSKVEASPFGEDNAIEIWTNGEDISVLKWECDIISQSLESVLFDAVKSTNAVDAPGRIYNDAGILLMPPNNEPKYKPKAGVELFLPMPLIVLLAFVLSLILGTLISAVVSLMDQTKMAAFSLTAERINRKIFLQ